MVTRCLVQQQQQPKSVAPYQCLMAAAAQGNVPAVERALAQLRRRLPDDPRPLFYAALMRTFSEENVPDEAYERAVVGFRRDGEPVGRVYSLTTLAANRCFSHSLCDEKTEDLLTEAEVVAEGSGNVHLRRLAQLFWLREAMHADDAGRAERALARLEATPGEDPPWLGQQIFEIRGRAALFLNNYHQQYAVYAEMLAASPAGGAMHASALGNMGQAAAHLAVRGEADRRTAEELLRRALKEQQQLGLEMTISGDGLLRTTESLAALLGPTTESIRLLEANLARYAGRGPRKTEARNPYRSEWLLARDLVDSTPPRAAEALHLADESVERAAQAGRQLEHAHGLLVRAYVRWRSRQREEALQDANAALGEMEQLRSKQEDVEIRIRYEDALAFSYELVAGLLLDPTTGRVEGKDMESAFSVMERLRARALFENLLARGRVGDARVQHETALRRQILQAHQRLLDPATPLDSRTTAVNQLREAERALAHSQHAAVALAEPPTLAQVQAALGAQEALVSFQVWRAEAPQDASYTNGHSWALVVTHSGTRAVALPNGDAFEAQLNFFRQLLEARDGSEKQGGLTLYDALLRPVVEALPPGIESLVLIPDGPLHRLPFDALFMSPSGPYLAERFRTSLVPSAAIWLRLRQGAGATPGLALAVADATQEDAAASSGGVGFGHLAGLTQAEGEAARAVRAFPAGSQLLTGVTGPRLASMDLAPFALLHIATHSLVDPLRPERSGVVLDSGAAGTAALLDTEAISRLSLEGKVVVLASCETSSGLIRRGEGVMSLSRAFFAAGARTVIGSLRRVRDSESAAFFDAFYAALETGLTVGEALGLAKTTRLRAGAPAAAWSDFVLLGDATAAPRAAKPKGRDALLAVFLGTGAALVAAGVVGLRRRRRSWHAAVRA